MEKNSFRVLLLGLSLLVGLASPLHAKLRLPNCLSDNMVLQSGQKAALWGWATPGAVVKIAPSWTSAQTVTADRDGRWEAAVLMPEAGYTPLSITFKGDGTRLTVSNKDRRRRTGRHPVLHR